MPPNQQVGTPAPPTGSCIIGKVTDNGIRKRIPQTRDDQDYAQPEGTEPQAYISHQTYEYAGNVEEGDGNNAPGTIGS